MSSGGRLSRKQKRKAVVTSSSPARDTSGDPLEEFESVHPEVMMDARSLDVPRRLLVSESARLHQEEVIGAPTEAQVCARDCRGGAGEVVPPVNYVPTCHYPGGIFEELPALAPKLLHSPEVSGQSWENVLKTPSTPGLIRITKNLSYSQNKNLGSPDLKVG